MRSSTTPRRRPSLVLALALLTLAAGCAEKRAPAPDAPEEPAPSTATPAGEGAAAEAGGEVTITPLVHGSVLLRQGSRSVYVDPWSKASFEGLPKADIILITDIHPDHLDPAAIDAIRGDATLIIGPQAVADKLPGVEVLANGERAEVTQVPGMVVEAVPMYNLQRGPEEGKLFHDKGRGNGYIVTLGGQRIYLSGDTECTDEMRALEAIDVAFVCMNLPYTMPPAEAIECIRAFRPKVVYPYHYRGSDPGEVARAFADEPAIEVRLAEWYPGGEG